MNRHPARAGRKKSLLLIIRVETLKQLQEQAREAARAQGLTKTDLAYGDFLADHIAGSLETAYKSDAAQAAPIDAGEILPSGDAHEGQWGEMTFIGVSLSSVVAKRLLARAREDAVREGITTDRDRETFVFRCMGQLLEASYSRCA